MKYFIPFLLLVLTNISYSSLQIKVIDDENSEPIPYVKVIGKCLDKNCIDSLQFGLTNKIGLVKLNLELPCKVEINHLGYEITAKSFAKGDELIVKLHRKQFILDEIVTTGQYTPRSSQKSVYQIKTITSEQIKAHNATNLRDLMTNEMNVKLSQDPTLGSSISINGISGQNVKILIDGIPVIGRENGNIDLSQINLNNAERVEIIQGPMSTMYGSDAAGGVINIISKDYFDEKVFLNANSYYESIGTFNFDGGIGYNLGKYNILLNGGRNFFAGYSPVDTSRYKLWKPKEQYFTDWQFNAFRDKMTIRYSGKYFYDYILNRGTPVQPYNEFAFDDHYKTYRLSNTLSVKGEVGEGRYIDVQADYSTYERRKNTFLKNLVTLKEVLTADSTDQDTSDFKSWMLRGTYSHDNAFEKLSYQIGFDINLQSGSGAKIKNKEDNIDDYAAFVSFQYLPIKEITIQPAVRYIYNSKYKAPVIPSLNIRAELSDAFALRMSYAQGFRAPSLKELYLLFVDVNHNIKGNEELVAEKSHNFNIGVDIHAESEKHAFKLENNFYYNYINDLIYLINTDIVNNMYSYVNIGTFKGLGYNITLSYMRHNFSSKIGASISANSYESKDPKFNLSPEIMANIIWTSGFYDIKFNVFYKYNGRQNQFLLITDTDYQEFTLNDYHMADISVSKDFWDNQINISLGVKNVFDVVNVANSQSSSGGVHTGGSLGSSAISYGRIFTAGIRLNLK
ncbi:MAG TPA: TonB-dependent receptor [Candidatus Kapabacteria bacterium]|nr:TonB-dependent receptor [Candidatus Kapabacteria bacterium]